MTPAATRERVRCRLISEGDLAAVADLLCEGFKGRPRAVWEAGLERLRLRDAPVGAPRFGYCLEAGERLVGVILIIASRREINGVQADYSNVASWYVKTDYRAYAQLLVSIALRKKETTYTNISPAPHTWSIVESQGYTRYCSGLFFAFGLLSRPVKGVRISAFDVNSHQGIAEFELLRRHNDMGCNVVVAEDGGTGTGFVFRRYCVRGGRLPMPGMIALHVPNQTALVRYAGNLSRYFLSLAAPILVMDADEPVRGLRGVYTQARGRKYFKGPHNPGLCRLADSEYAIFGV